jgi:hypothetical protein
MKTCKYCRCTDVAGCYLTAADLNATLAQLPIAHLGRLVKLLGSKLATACFWINAQHSVCSNPRCVKKHIIRLRAQKRRRRLRLRNGRQFLQRRAS